MIPGCPHFEISEKGRAFFKDHGLSERSIEIAVASMNHLRTEDMARALFIQNKSVKEHLSRILKRFGLKTRLNLVVFLYPLCDTFSAPPGVTQLPGGIK